VDVYELGLFLPEQPYKFPSRIARPDNILHQRHPLEDGIPFDLGIASPVRNYVMAAQYQELTLLFKGDVFASGLLVRVVDEENVHV
jgi:hypothetical protein